MKRKVIAIGNALGVTLPSEMLIRYGLDKGQEVEVTDAEDHIEISPAKSIAELLDSWEPIGPRVSLDDIVEAIRRDRDSR